MHSSKSAAFQQCFFPVSRYVDPYGSQISGSCLVKLEPFKTALGSCNCILWYEHERCVSAVRGNQNGLSLTVSLPDSPKEKLMVEIPIKERWETVTSPDTLSDKKAGALLLSPVRKDFCNQSTQTNLGQTPVFQKRWRKEVRNGLTGQCKAVESWVLQCSTFLYPHTCMP